MDDFSSILSTNAISGIPIVHHKSHLWNFKNVYDAFSPNFFKSLVTLTDNYLSLDFNKTPRYLFLCGFPGSGKTHFMVGLYRALAHKIGYTQGDGPLFCPFQSVAQELIEGFKENIPLRVGLQGHTNSRWLFLDDFTSSERVLKEGSLEQTVLRDVILDRYDSNTCLVTSSNLQAKDLLSEMNRLFGSYIVSRLSLSTIIQFPNIDLRKNGVRI